MQQTEFFLHFISVKATVIFFIRNVMIDCLSLLFMMVNEDSLGFGLFHGAKKQFENGTFGQVFFLHFKV